MGQWEASSSRRIQATPATIWGLWSDPARWSDWNPAIESATLANGFEAGGTAWILFHARRRPMKFRILAAEPERRFLDEGRLPGARIGHDHRIELDYEGNYAVRVSHRLYIEGPLARFWAWRLGPEIERDLELFLDREGLLAVGRTTALPEPAPLGPRCPLVRAVKSRVSS